MASEQIAAITPRIGPAFLICAVLFGCSEPPHDPDTSAHEKTTAIDDDGSASESDALSQPRTRPTPMPLDTAPAALDRSIEWITDSSARVELAGEIFSLEIADTNGERYRGLSFRDEIDPRGGMVFVFPDDAIRDFVMRDCRVPIDIAYTTDTGRIVAMHEMTVDLRLPGESQLTYDQRLTRYSSRFPVGFVFEFAGGTLGALGVAEGDMISTDFAALKARAK